MRRVIALMLASVLPMQAAALSCMPWNMENSFQVASDSPDPYVIALGHLTFSKHDLPKVDWDNQQNVPQETHIKAHMTGHTLSRAGFETPFDSDVDIVLRCAGPWCPAVEPNAQYLAFLKKTEGGYELTYEACAAMGYYSPDPEVLEKVKACFAGKPCDPPTH